MSSQDDVSVLGAVTRTRSAESRRERTEIRGPGGALLAIAAITAIAELFGRIFPATGPPVFAILVGVAARQFAFADARARKAVSVTSRQLLQAAIVILGATFSLGRVATVGRASLPIMLTTLVAALVLAVVFGRFLRIGGRLQVLIGVGTAICGASAIAAVSTVIAATEAEIAYAIATIFAFNVAAVLLYPALGHLLSLAQHSFGLWAGTSINDTSSVVAAAYSYGHVAGNYALIVKLTRATMIVPIVLVLSAVAARRPGAGAPRRIVPWFILWFVLAAAVGSSGVMNASFRHALAAVAMLSITAALAAVGLSTSLRSLRHTGWRPLLLGGLLWAAVGVMGLGLQQFY